VRQPGEPENKRHVDAAVRVMGVVQRVINGESSVLLWLAARNSIGGLKGRSDA